MVEKYCDASIAGLLTSWKTIFMTIRRPQLHFPKEKIEWSEYLSISRKNSNV